MVSAVRLQIYFFSTVFVLFQTFASTESFNCDDSNAVYCLVKYLRAKSEGRQKTENGWQWAVKKNPSENSNIDVQWRNWTTVENKTNPDDGPCLTLCLTGSGNLSEAGQGSDSSCSNLLCKLLAAKNCTNGTSENESGVEPNGRNGEGEEGRRRGHPSTISYIQPEVTTQTVAFERTYSESFPYRYTKTEVTVPTLETEKSYSGHPYGTITRLTTTTAKPPETSIHLFGSSEGVDIETPKVTRPFYSTKGIYSETSKVFGSSYSTEGPEVTEELTTPVEITSTTTEKVTTTTEKEIDTTTTSPQFGGPTISWSTTTELPKTTVGFVRSSYVSSVPPDHSTTTEATTTTTSSYGYFVTKETRPESIMYTDEEPLTPVYGNQLFSSKTVTEKGPQTTEEYEIIEDKTTSFQYVSETPETSTQYLSRYSSTTLIPEEYLTGFVSEVTSIAEVPLGEDDFWVCVPRTKLPSLLAAYDAQGRGDWSRPCSCCGPDDKEKYFLDFLNWYNQLPEADRDLLEKRLPKSNNNMLYHSRGSYMKPNSDQYFEIPEIDDKYIVKNTHSGKSKNHFGYPNGRIGGKGHEMNYYSAKKKGPPARKHYSFESPPINGEDDDQPVIYLEYVEPESQKGGIKPISYEFGEKPSNAISGMPPLYVDAKNEQPGYGGFIIGDEEVPIGGGVIGETKKPIYGGYVVKDDMKTRGGKDKMPSYGSGYIIKDYPDIPIGFGDAGKSIKPTVGPFITKVVEDVRPAGGGDVSKGKRPSSGGYIIKEDIKIPIALGDAGKSKKPTVGPFVTKVVEDVKPAGGGGVSKGKRPSSGYVKNEEKTGVDNNGKKPNYATGYITREDLEIPVVDGGARKGKEPSNTGGFIIKGADGVKTGGGKTDGKYIRPSGGYIIKGEHKIPFGTGDDGFLIKGLDGVKTGGGKADGKNIKPSGGGYIIKDEYEIPFGTGDDGYLIKGLGGVQTKGGKADVKNIRPSGGGYIIKEEHEVPFGTGGNGFFIKSIQELMTRGGDKIPSLGGYVIKEEGDAGKNKKPGYSGSIIRAEGDGSKNKRPGYGAYYAKRVHDESPGGGVDDKYNRHNLYSYGGSGYGKFDSIYKVTNQARIPNTFANPDHRYIIIKDDEGTRKISEDVLNKINGKYKVQYVIIDKNNHTRHVDLQEIFNEKIRDLENLESTEDIADQRIYKSDDNAIKSWYDTFTLGKGSSAKVGKREVEKGEKISEEETSEMMSLFSPEHQTQLRRRIVRQPYEHKKNELHESEDGSYHHHLSENPAVEVDLKRVFVPDDQLLSSLDYDKISSYVVRRLVKRDMMESYDSKNQKKSHPNHVHKSANKKQQNVRKNLNSFEQAYLRNPISSIPHFGHNPKSEADVLAELQHSGGIRKKGWHSAHKHGIYPDKVGLQIVSDLQKIRKNHMLRNSGVPFVVRNKKREVHQATPTPITAPQTEKHAIPTREEFKKLQEHLQQEEQQPSNKNNNNYNFHEVYPHSNYYSSVTN